MVDMAVERDVCDFLVESGCIEIIIGTVSTSEDTSGRFYRVRNRMMWLINQ